MIRLRATVLFLLFSLALSELSGPLNTLKRDLSKVSSESGAEQDESPANQNENEDVSVNEIDSVAKRVNNLFLKLKEMKEMQGGNHPLSEDDKADEEKVKRDISKLVGTEVKDGTQKDTDSSTQQAFLQMQRWIKVLSDFGREFDGMMSEEAEENPEETLNSLPILPSEPVVELTPKEIESERLYQLGMSQLNKNRGDKVKGYIYIFEAADMGHIGALVKLAWGLLYGNYIEQNIISAREIFESLAEMGNADAHTGLGLLYASGIGVNVSQSRALVHLTMGALGENTWAQMALGYRYWAGVTVPTDCERALDFYRKAATKVVSDVTFSGGAAIQRVRLLDEHENSGLSSGILYNNLIDYYHLMAEKGNIETQVGLAQLHYQGGRGVPLDIEKAMHYFTKASNAGNAEAMAFLGKIYLEGSDNVEASNETALRYFRKAAELNNPVGQSGLGLMYLQGRGVTKDTNQALKYFKLAADQGWVEGHLYLGSMYFDGIGVRRDFKLAKKYFSLATQSGHVLGFYYLGQMHARGIGMLPSCTTAVELFKNVAERGKWGVQLMLAYNDHKLHPDRAFVQYAILGQLGYEVAQSNAAFLLDKGEVKLFGGPPEDYVRALTYWSRAATQGYSSAQVKLGDYHYYGLGTPVDYETAASHYRLASDQQHNAQAMFNLGYMHEQGLGMRRDMHLAKRCYDLAAETSTDAKVPVALALVKLFFLFGFEAIQESQLALLFKVDESLISNWDIYLISTLTGILGVIVYFRRPIRPQPGN